MLSPILEWASDLFGYCSLSINENWWVWFVFFLQEKNNLMKSESEECAKCGIKNVFTFTTSASCLYLTLPLGSVNKTQHNIQNVYYTGVIVLFKQNYYTDLGNWYHSVIHFLLTSSSPVRRWSKDLEWERLRCRGRMQIEINTPSSPVGLS